MASFSVTTNIAALQAQSAMAKTSQTLQTALRRVSSGLRINSAGDDAAGLAIANTYRHQVTSLNQGIRNANDAVSSLQTMDGAMDNIGRLLDRLSTLATQAASMSSQVDRLGLDHEYQSVLTEIDREAQVATIDADQHFSVFISNDGPAGTVGATFRAVSVAVLQLSQTDIKLPASAQSAVAGVASAVTQLGSSQASIGAMQNRLQFAVALSQSRTLGLSAAESRLRDADLASEAANLSRASILSQSGVAALAQANQQSSAVLALLH